MSEAPRTEPLSVAGLRRRAKIRRDIPRWEPDRISDQLEWAADRIEQLERELSDMTDDYMRRHKDARDRAMRIADLERELAEARKDAERYQWIRDRIMVSPALSMAGNIRPALAVRIGCAYFDSPLPRTSDERYRNQTSATLDATIDAARSQKEG